MILADGLQFWQLQKNALKNSGFNRILTDDSWTLVAKDPVIDILSVLKQPFLGQLLKDIIYV